MPRRDLIGSLSPFAILCIQGRPFYCAEPCYLALRPSCLMRKAAPFERLPHRVIEHQRRRAPGEESTKSIRHAGSAQVRINLDCGPVNRSMASRATADNPASIGASVRYSGRQLRKSSCNFGCGKAANSLITATALRLGDFLSSIREAVSRIALRNLLASSNC